MKTVNVKREFLKEVELAMKASEKYLQRESLNLRGFHRYVSNLPLSHKLFRWFDEELPSRHHDSTKYQLIHDMLVDYEEGKSPDPADPEYPKYEILEEAFNQSGQRSHQGLVNDLVKIRDG